MTIRQLKEIISEFEDEDVICYQDERNIYRYVPIHGFEVIRPKKGKPMKKIVLLSTKELNREYNG